MNSWDIQNGCKVDIEGKQQGNDVKQMLQKWFKILVKYLFHNGPDIDYFVRCPNGSLSLAYQTLDEAFVVMLVWQTKTTVVMVDRGRPG